MKKILLFLFLSFSFFSKAQTNVYHPFPDSNATWNMKFVFYCGPPAHIDVEEDYSYTLTGDTIVGANTYHKLDIPFVITSFIGCTGTIPVYRGCIRQDTSIRKVYYVQPGDTVEQLFYDFNMQVGDTVRGYRAYWINPADTVISIDSILIGNNYRKRWFINATYNRYIIEGIGSTMGFLTHPEETLICFQQGGQTLYPDNISSCNLVTSTNQLSTVNSQLSISPNPAHNKLIVECKLQNGELKIYDMMGRVVMEERIHSPVSIFNLQLAGGVYLLRVSDGEKTEVQKLIVE